jgi:8-oxo-dGTP pyrophosphatase MutT (NUDIX family)
MGSPDLDLLKSRLVLEATPPPPALGLRPAGVLAPLFLASDKLHLLFTQRTWTVKDHQGQISFPGGVQDGRDRDLLATALRETQEEIGLEPQRAEILGSLKPIATVTGFWITAYVALIPYPYHFRPSPEEVARLLLLPLHGFADPRRWSAGPYTFQGRSTQVCYWRHRGIVIWGATARLLLDLLAHLDIHPFAAGKDTPCVD